MAVLSGLFKSKSKNIMIEKHGIQVGDSPGGHCFINCWESREQLTFCLKVVGLEDIDWP